MHEETEMWKQDGYLGHYTYHLIHDTHNLTVMLSLLFSSMLTHSYTPDAMLVSTIAQILKHPRKHLNDSGNYKGIFLSSAIAKTTRLGFPCEQ